MKILDLKTIGLLALAIGIAFYILGQWRAARRRRKGTLRLRSQREQAAFETVKTTYSPRPFRRTNRSPKRD